METTEKGKRGGNRKGIFKSHEEWDKAGRPDGWIFDHRSGRGRRLTAAERQKAAAAQRRADHANRRDPKFLRTRLERLKAEIID